MSRLRLGRRLRAVLEVQSECSIYQHPTVRRLCFRNRLRRISAISHRVYLSLSAPVTIEDRFGSGCTMSDPRKTVLLFFLAP
jgi:hypothetical protein